MLHQVARGCGALTIAVFAVGCAASGSDSQVHGPVYDVDGSAGDAGPAGDDGPPPAPEASTAGEDAAPAEASAPLDSAAPGTDAGEDASDGALPVDASDAAASDASSICAGFDAATDPFTGVDAVVGATIIPDNGTVAANQAVTINAWTLPSGIMKDVSVAYTTNNFATPAVLVTMTLDPGDSGAPGQDKWSGQIPGQASGTQVAWYAVGHDACTAAAQYYSNLNANYHYKAQ